jgi:hypothetical protein
MATMAAQTNRAQEMKRAKTTTNKCERAPEMLVAKGWLRIFRLILPAR